MMATLRRFMALLLVVQRSTRDLTGKPGPTFPDRALKPGILARDDVSSNCHPAPSICLSMISGKTRTAFVPRGKPVSTFPDHTPGALFPQKGSPAKKTGQTLRVAAQYIQKTPKNKDLLGMWLVDFGRIAGPKCPFRGRDRPPAKPPRNGL